MMQAAYHHLGEWNEIPRLCVDRRQHLAAANHLFHAPLAILGKFVEDDVLVLLEGRDAPIDRERGVHPFHLGIGE